MDSGTVPLMSAVMVSLIDSEPNFSPERPDMLDPPCVMLALSKTDQFSNLNRSSKSLLRVANLKPGNGSSRLRYRTTWKGRPKYPQQQSRRHLSLRSMLSDFWVQLSRLMLAFNMILHCRMIPTIHRRRFSPFKLQGCICEGRSESRSRKQCVLFPIRHSIALPSHPMMNAKF
jgi:hypothetical protein